jgi:hypothetical protein
MSGDLRVPQADYRAGATLIQKLAAIFARLQPVLWEASESSEQDIEATLARLTTGQRIAYAIEQLQMEVANGGFDQYFFNSAGELAREALEGLRLLDLHRFAIVMERAMAEFPGGNVPRARDGRQELLAQGLSERLSDADLDSEWNRAYEVEEEVSKAVLAYVDAHPEEFFLDASDARTG